MTNEVIVEENTADEEGVKVNEDETIGMDEEDTIRVDEEETIGVDEETIGVDEGTIGVDEETIGVGEEEATKTGEEDNLVDVIGMGNEETIGIADEETTGVADEETAGVDDTTGGCKGAFTLNVTTMVVGEYGSSMNWVIMMEPSTLVVLTAYEKVATGLVWTISAQNQRVPESSSIWMTIERPIIPNTPKRGTLGSQYVSSMLFRPESPPNLPLKSPTSYWSLVVGVCAV